MKKKIKLSLTDLLLLALEKGVEGGEFFFNSMTDLKRWIYDVYGDYPRPITKPALSQAIRRLRERGLLEREERKAGEIIIKLTQGGKRFVALSKNDNFKWDGRWRIVIFDIPESKRQIRDVLRGRLKSWGFIPWQKSVWVSQKHITKELREFIKELEIDDWVLVIESDNVGS